MKLYYTPQDPYGRKVRAAVIKLGMLNEIKMIEVQPNDLPQELIDANPLRKTPTLLTNDGAGLYSSRVILEYLNSFADSTPIIPLSGAMRWLVLRVETLADALANALIKRYTIRNGQQNEQKPGDLQSYYDVVYRILDYFEHKIPSYNINAATLSLACALEILNGPYGDEFKDWKEKYPALCEWFDKISQENCLKQTKPIWEK